MAEIPTPAITDGPVTPDNVDGHFCVCPVCGQVLNVVVTDVPFVAATGAEMGRTSDYDLSAYTDHYQAEHSA